MALPRFDNLDSAQQEVFLAAAAAEFADRGYASASVNRIVERAESSKGQLYYYFQDKEDLFVTVLEAAIERLLTETGMSPEDGGLEEWLSTLEADTYWDALRESVRGSLWLLRSEAWYVRLARAFYRLRAEPEAREATGRVLEGTRDLAAGLLRRGQELGTVRTDLPLDLLVEVYMAMDQAGDRWMLERFDAWDDTELAHIMDARVDLARDMLDREHEGWNS